MSSNNSLVYEDGVGFRSVSGLISSRSLEHRNDLLLDSV